MSVIGLITSEMTSGSTKDTLDRKDKVKFINFFVKKMGAHLLIFFDYLLYFFCDLCIAG